MNNDKAIQLLTVLLLSNANRKQFFEIITNEILRIPPYLTENEIHDRMTVTKEFIKNSIENQPNLSESDKAKKKALVDTLWQRQRKI